MKVETFFCFKALFRKYSTNKIDLNNCQVWKLTTESHASTFWRGEGGEVYCSGIYEHYSF